MKRELGLLLLVVLVAACGKSQEKKKDNAWQQACDSVDHVSADVPSGYRFMEALRWIADNVHDPQVLRTIAELAQESPATGAAQFREEAKKKGGVDRCRLADTWAQR